MKMKKINHDGMPFGRALAILTKSYYGALTKRLEHLDIERYYSVLLIIEESENKCTQQDICDFLKIDKVTMVRIMDYLVNKKLIKKDVNPTDRREYVIALTKKAVAIMPSIHEAIESLNKDALKGIPKQKQKELHENLAMVQSNLNQLPSHKIFINYKKSK